MTDCVELHEWMVRHLEEYPLFERLPEAEEAADPIVPFISTRTDESIKVARNQGGVSHAPSKLSVSRWVTVTIEGQMAHLTGVGCLGSAYSVSVFRRVADQRAAASVGRLSSVCQAEGRQAPPV